jgi:hypothetical protein
MSHILPAKKLGCNEDSSYRETGNNGCQLNGRRQTFLAVGRGNQHDLSSMGDYPGRKQVRNRVKRAAKNDRIIEQRAAEKKAATAKKK